MQLCWQRFSLFLFGVCVPSLFLSSCFQTTSTFNPNYSNFNSSLPYTNQGLVPGVERSSVSHVVGPMETVWRLSKMYDVPVAEIIRTNNLGVKAVVKEGQRLVIPNAAPVRPVIPLYPSNKWKYIIIHHSATDVGSAASFNKAHYKRGFWNGLGYHFVIDNGTQFRNDGQVEVSPRWIKQLNGAHCKAGNMNEQAIGICLVGDFSSAQVSEAQMQSLVFVVRQLAKYYGTQTECPGRNFPWYDFRQKI